MQSQKDVDATPSQCVVSTPTLPFEPYYKDERCTIYNADSRKVLPWLPKFDLLLTDPPYGLGDKLTKASKPEHRTWDTGGDAVVWDVRPQPWELQMMLESASDYIVWGGNYFCESLRGSQCVLVWDNMNGTNPMADCEIAMTSFAKGARMFSRHHFSAGCGGKVHPTQKPLPVMQWCISMAGENVKTIIDPFAGAMTTLLAAKVEGRNAVGIEINEKYCEAGAKRLEQGVLF